MKTIEASYVLTLERYKQINRISYYRSRALWVGVLIFVLATAAFAYLTYNYFVEAGYQFSREFFNRSWMDTGLVVIYAFFLWSLLVGRLRRLNRILIKSPLHNAVYNYRFTTEKLQSRTSKDDRIISETTMDWNLIPLAFVYKDLILLRMAMGYYFVPADAFKTREDYEEFKDFINHNIKKIISRRK